MSKKTKRSTPRAAISPTPRTPDALAHKARANLSGGQYREAIADFKQLIKQAPHPDWRARLADAYAGRARELSSKGMLKEALVMWDNRASLGNDLPPDMDHARLQLRLGQTAPVCALLADAAKLPAADAERLRALLAARLLSGDATIAMQLTEADPVRRHAEAARTALAAYCTSDEKGLREALAALPFRSPYRDWAQSLKALQCLPDQPREAATLLAQIREDSAFIDVKRAAELALLPESLFLERLRHTDKRQSRFACVLRGWSAARIALWEKIARLGDEPSPQAMLRALYQQREALGVEWMRHRALRLLWADFPASLKWMSTAGAPSLTSKESLLVAAWAAESSKHPRTIYEAWREYAYVLAHDESDDQCDPHLNLRIALILRRCNRLANVLRDAHFAGFTYPHKLIVRQVEASLKLDPNDLDTWLDLIDYYRHCKQVKDARRLLTGASERWPDDRRLLATAMDIALDGGAFKRATVLARRILAQDSINTEVRERLVDAYLAHASKQIFKKRLDLAHKTLAEADEWASGGAARERLDLTLALVALIEDSPTAASVLRERVKRLGDGLAAFVTLAVTANALKLPLPQLFTTIDCPQLTARSPEDLLAGLARLRAYLDRGGTLSSALSDALTQSFKDAPWKHVSRSDLATACETLRRSQLHALRRTAALAGIRQWRGAPLFVFHVLEAKYLSNQSRLSDPDSLKLEAAMQRARDEGDERTFLRIDELLLNSGYFDIAPPAKQMSNDEDDFARLTELFRQSGLEAGMNALNMPPDIKRKFRKIVSEVGEKNALEMIINLYEQIQDDDQFSGLSS